MNRRTFLRGASLAVLGQLLLACERNNLPTLQVDLLSNTLPPQLIRKFRSQTRSQLSVKIGLQSDLSEILSLLQRLQQPPSSPSPPSRQHLVSLGDYWLTPAIQQNLIQPLQIDQLSHWPSLPTRWQQLATRDRQGQLVSDGEVWGAPYRWGATLIAYRRDKFQDLGWPPRDWSDLWRPELNGRFSLLDHPREVIGLTLKSLDQSYNSDNLATISDLLPQLQALHRQVKFYASTNYLQPLIQGDIWAAVGWSTDILPVVEREANVEAVVPQSGTALWSDLWVYAQSPGSDSQRSINGAHEWVNFWWDRDIAQDLSKFTDAVSPLTRAMAKDDIPSILPPAPQIFERSEFLRPLNRTAINQYQAIWAKMRQT